MSIISPNLLFIGRQVPTLYGGLIDILAMEENGDLVIVELKREKTPRDITAQVLDYASWVKTLTNDQIQEIAEKYGKINLEEAYQAKFGSDFPEVPNQEHKMLVIGSEIDNSSQRIINYLSETHGVNINAVSFNYFKNEDSEFLARTFLIEPTKAEIQAKSGKTKRRYKLTEEQLQEIADEKEVGELYKYTVDQLNLLFDYKGTTLSSIAFISKIDGKQRTIFSLVPEESSHDRGVKFIMYLSRFASNFKMTEGDVKSYLPKNKKPWKYYKNAPPEWCGYEGYFQNIDEVKRLIENIGTKKS
jgi:hypothetical protein